MDIKMIHPWELAMTATSLKTYGWQPGELRVDAQGRIYRLVKASSATTISAGLVYCWNDNATNIGEVVVSGAAMAVDVAGIGIGTIPASSYGWIQFAGHCAKVIGDPENGVDIVAGAGVVTYGAAGKCQGADMTVATNVAGIFGVAQEGTTSGSAQEVAVFLKGLI